MDNLEKKEIQQLPKPKKKGSGRIPKADMHKYDIQTRYHYKTFPQFKKQINDYFQNYIKKHDVPSWDSILRFCGYKEGVAILEHWKGQKTKNGWTEYLYSNKERLVLKIYNYAERYSLNSNLVLHYLDRMFPANNISTTPLNINLNIGTEEEYKVLNLLSANRDDSKIILNNNIEFDNDNNILENLNLDDSLQDN